MSRENLKYILITLIALLAFTFALNTFDHSKLQLNEYSDICHSLYSEKVWIDTCNLPMMQNNNSYEIAIKIEIAGIILTGVLFILRVRNRK